MADAHEMKNLSDTNRSSDEKVIAGTQHDPTTEKAILGGAAALEAYDLPPDPDAHLSVQEKAAIDRKLLWKLDLQLIPWLCVLYLMSFLDRTNIGNAKIAGLTTDVGLNDQAYNAGLTIFFVSYALAEPLTNVLLKRLRPSIFIPAIMIAWGTIMMLMGFIQHTDGLLASRFWLGLAEAGLFPGVNYYLSCWYKRSEFGIRAAIFFSAAAVSGSFGGLLAAAINKMAGIGGRPGWAWIFILEGLLTVLFGVLSFWAVHDFPDEATFLTEQDRARVIRRLKMDQQSSAEHEKFKMAYFYAALRDYKMWIGMAIYMGCDMPLYGFSLFLPTIIKDMSGTPGGYPTVTAQLLTVPPYAVAACFTIFIGWLADRTHQRGLCNMGVSIIGMVGFAMLIASDGPKIRYAATFLGALGIYPCIANTISWVSNNVEGVYKRGIILGFVIGWGNLNGIVSSNIFPSKDASRYIPGNSVILSYMVVFLFGGSLAMYLLLRRENNLRLNGKRDFWVEGMTREEAEKLGDRRPDFIYTL